MLIVLLCLLDFHPKNESESFNENHSSTGNYQPFPALGSLMDPRHGERKPSIYSESALITSTVLLAFLRSHSSLVETILLLMVGREKRESGWFWGN